MCRCADELVPYTRGWLYRVVAWQMFRHLRSTPGLDRAVAAALAVADAVAVMHGLRCVEPVGRYT
jgi:hypothetical protein